MNDDKPQYTRRRSILAERTEQEVKFEMKEDILEILAEHPEPIRRPVLTLKRWTEKQRKGP